MRDDIIELMLAAFRSRRLSRSASAISSAFADFLAESTRSAKAKGEMALPFCIRANFAQIPDSGKSSPVARLSKTNRLVADEHRRNTGPAGPWLSGHFVRCPGSPVGPLHCYRFSGVQAPLRAQTPQSTFRTRRAGSTRAD